MSWKRPRASVTELLEQSPRGLSGPVGEPVAVTFRDGNDDMVTLDIVRAENKGRRIQFGHLPATYVWIDTRMLEGNIGYIAFNMFFDPD